MTYLIEAPVLENLRLRQHHYRLTVGAPEIAARALPGQFVMAAEAAADSLPYPLLKRALAVYSVRHDENRPAAVSMLIKTVGPGTRRLATLEAGDSLNLMGPLGNGFDLDLARGKVTLLVAGGVGIASVYMLAQQLLARGDEVHLLYGGRTAEDLVVLDDFTDLGIPVFTATEDGSRGFHGLVTEGLQGYVNDFVLGRLVIYTCGPSPMMRAVCKLAADRDIPCQISVEAKMACGFGVCLGCSVKTVDSYRLACQHGPVFDGREFVWED